MFVLDQKIKMGYGFGAWTFYKTKHKGQDYKANQNLLYAPFDCHAGSFKDEGGGYWVQFTFGDYIIQCAHLSQYLRLGDVTQGTAVAITGNSGKYTTGPHLHLQIYYKNQLINPETFNWEEGLTMSQYQDLVNVTNTLAGEIHDCWTRIEDAKAHGMNAEKSADSLYKIVDSTNKNLDKLYTIVDEINKKLGQPVPQAQFDTETATVLQNIVNFIKDLFKKKG